MSSTLYICYFGLREPLVQTQVLPYLRELLKDRHEITLLTFEPDMNTKWTGEQIAKAKAEMSAEGIEWECLAYHKRPSALATAYDIFRGALRVKGIIEKKKIDILHGRVHVPTLMGALGRKFSRTKPKLLFDIRGFFPEEYTDAGIWPENGWLYRGAKRVESWLMKKSDGFVVLTKKAREILFPEIDTHIEDGGHDKLGRPVEVIPCCVDMKRFASANPESRRAVREELGIDTRFVGVYVGAFGGWYMAEETADLFGAMKQKYPNVFAMILTQSNRNMIEPLLNARGFSERDAFIAKIPSAEIPRYLSAADIAVSFIKPCYSKLASSPTKNAEYLACGLPIIANQGVGDVEELINCTGVGVLIRVLDADGYRRGLEDLARLENISERCRETAAVEFDLMSVGGRRYQRIYSKLLERG